MDKDVKKLLKEAARSGWRFAQRGGHMFGKHEDGKRMVTVSISASDRRALLNMRKDLGV